MALLFDCLIIFLFDICDTVTLFIVFT